MEGGETIKQINLITYLALTISCSCLKLFQYDKEIMYVFTPSGILKDWSSSLPGTCEYSCFHEFMNSWIHELSRYMKIRWCNRKYTLIHLYCNYQGKWKSGEYIWRFTFIHLYCNYQGTCKSGEYLKNTGFLKEGRFY